MEVDFGAGRGLSSEDSENTGVPYLKEVFSVSLSDEGSEEESISSTTGDDCLAGRGVDWKAIWADLRVGLFVGLAEEEICGFGVTGFSLFEGSSVWPLLGLDGGRVLGILVCLATILHLLRFSVVCFTGVACADWTGDSSI